MADQTKPVDAPGCFYCLNVKPLFRKAWSDATKDHFRNARVEFLRGVRSVIDDRINNLARHEAKGTHVTVE
ncbi:MAG TPA: hypothetical protein VMT86_01800 [Bryobacteraceae bacterium]|nr:hypothetical protein [Bryobacteraceae bacterium]